jgi:octaprenyl-diphosphate synthase
VSDLKNRILSLVKDDLDGIEAALLENLHPNLELVSKVAHHILFSGGKRLRPLLMVLSARLCDYRGDYDKTFSVIFEYLHAATLLHDDLVDGADLRRGKPASHTVWGNEIAVLVGDFLLARGLAIAAETNEPRIIKIISEITENMSQGEIHQIDRKGKTDLSETEYMDIIKCKTAVLFQGACRISAILAEAPEEKEVALAQYGYHLGMAFQMVDDLLDYTFDTQVLGKTVGADLREGKLTLPVIVALNHAGPGDRDLMEKVIQDERFTNNDFKWLIEKISEHGGFEYTRALAYEHTAKARQALELFPVSPTRDILFDIAGYALERTH